MPTGLNDSFIYEDFEHRLEVIVDKYSSATQIDLANVLVQLAFLYKVIYDFRVKVSLEPILKYSSSSSLQQTTDKNVSDEALIASNKIVSHYNLPREWLDSFYVAALTHVLPAPPESHIRLVLPKSMIKGLSKTEVESIIIRPLIPESSTLLIEVQNKATLNQINNFLKNNKDLVESYLDQLPVDPSVRTERRVMIVGQATWFVFQDQPEATWNEVLSELERLWGTKGKRLPKLPDDIQKLKILYKRYLDTLKSISNTKS